MFQKLVLFLLIVATLSLLSCGSTEFPLTYNSIRGSGNLVTVLIEDLGPFNAVTLNTIGDVNLTYVPGSENTVEVTIDHNLVRFITTEVTNGVLLIDLKTPQEVKVSGQKLTVDITMNGLSKLVLGENGVGTIKTDSSYFQVSEVELELAGVGDMELDLTVTELLTSTLTGTGDLTLTGFAQRHILTHEAVGTVHTYGFVTDTCILVSNSESNIEVEVQEYLNATINNIGNVYYRGNPAIDTSGTGPGLLMRDSTEMGK